MRHLITGLFYCFLHFFLCYSSSGVTYPGNVRGPVIRYNPIYK